jgi:Ankyrin repeats (3 copies)
MNELECGTTNHHRSGRLLYSRSKSARFVKPTASLSNHKENTKIIDSSSEHKLTRMFSSSRIIVPKSPQQKIDDNPMMYSSRTPNEDTASSYGRGDEIAPHQEETSPLPTTTFEQQEQNRLSRLDQSVVLKDPMPKTESTSMTMSNSRATIEYKRHRSNIMVRKLRQLFILKEKPQQPQIQIESPDVENRDHCPTTPSNKMKTLELQTESTLRRISSIYHCAENDRNIRNNNDATTSSRAHYKQDSKENDSIELKQRRDSRSSNLPIESTNIDGDTPLLIACSKNHHETVVLLLQRGAQVNFRNRYNGNTPLHYVCYNNNLLLAHLLIEQYHAAIDCKNKNGETPLHCATQYGHIEIVRYLLDTMLQQRRFRRSVRHTINQTVELPKENGRGIHSYNRSRSTCTKTTSAPSSNNRLNNSETSITVPITQTSSSSSSILHDPHPTAHHLYRDKKVSNKPKNNNRFENQDDSYNMQDIASATSSITCSDYDNDGSKSDGYDNDVRKCPMLLPNTGQTKQTKYVISEENDDDGACPEKKQWFQNHHNENNKGNNVKQRRHSRHCYIEKGEYDDDRYGIIPDHDTPTKMTTHKKKHSVLLVGSCLSSSDSALSPAPAPHIQKESHQTHNHRDQYNVLPLRSNSERQQSSAPTIIWTSSKSLSSRALLSLPRRGRIEC